MSLRLRTYKGASVLPFAKMEAYYVRPDLAARLEQLLQMKPTAYLPASALGDDGPLPVPEEKAEAADDPAYSWLHKGDSRKRNADQLDGTQAKRARHLPRLVELPEESGKQLPGRFYRIEVSYPFVLTDGQHYTALGKLLDTVQMEIAQFSFQIVDDQGVAAIGYDDVKDDDDDSYEIWDSLALPPFEAFDHLWNLNKNDISGTLIEGFLRPNQLSRAPKVYCAYYGSQGPLNDLENETLAAKAPKRFPWAKKSENAYCVLLWIPDLVPFVLFDSHRRWDYVWIPEAVRRVRTDSIPQKKLIFYAFSENAAWRGALWKPSPKYWVAAGTGGRGAMRCDTNGEFECYAIETDAAAKIMSDQSGPESKATRAAPSLAAALGLPVKKKTETKDDPMQTFEFPWSGGTVELQYYKAFKRVDKKRNLPRDTQPIRWMRGKPLVTETLGLTKKRKGDSLGAAKTGVPTGGPKGNRKSAGQVMLGEIGGTLESFGYKAWKGAATKLVSGVLEKDLQLSTFWTDRSAGLQAYEKGQGGAWGLVNASLTLRKTLRTAQEWCHLVGHGDGGQEVEPNFVSGSKHCNTEQLAIELTQRIYRERGHHVAVKVTTYLAPSRWGILTEDFDTFIEKLPYVADALRELKGFSPASPAAAIKQLGITRTKLTEGYFKHLCDDFVNANGGNIGFGDFKVVWPSAAKLKAKGMPSPDPKASQAGRLSKMLADATMERVLFAIPIAYGMRYRVYITREGSGPVEADTSDDSGKAITMGDKVFVQAVDHFFSGQREEMDYNEFQLLEWSVYLQLAKKVGPAELRRVETLVREKIAAQQALAAEAKAEKAEDKAIPNVLGS